MSINFIPNITGPNGELPCIPASTGHAIYTRIGNQNPTIAIVTNLNSSGPGSLASACETAGPTVVIFNVGGRINVINDFKIDRDDIHIAGQTAPYPGITIQSHNFGITNANNVIIEHIRTLCSDRHTNGGVNSDGYDNRDAFAIDGTCSNIVINHCTHAFGVDANVDLWDYSGPGSSNVTFRNCIFAPSLQWSIHPDSINNDTFDPIIAHPLQFLADARGERLDITGCAFGYAYERTPRIGWNHFHVCNNFIYKPNRPFCIEIYTKPPSDKGKWARVSGNASGNVCAYDVPPNTPKVLNVWHEEKSTPNVQDPTSLEYAENRDIHVWAAHNAIYNNNSNSSFTIPTAASAIARTSDLNGGAWNLDPVYVSDARPYMAPIPTTPVNENSVLNIAGPWAAMRSALEAEIVFNMKNRLGDYVNVYSNTPQTEFDEIFAPPYNKKYSGANAPKTTSERYNLESGGWLNWRNWLTATSPMSRMKHTITSPNTVLPSGYSRLEAYLHTCSRFVEYGYGAQDESFIDTQGRGWNSV